MHFNVKSLLVDKKKKSEFEVCQNCELKIKSLREKEFIRNYDGKSHCLAMKVRYCFSLVALMVFCRLCWFLGNSILGRWDVFLLSRTDSEADVPVLLSSLVPPSLNQRLQWLLSFIPKYGHLRFTMLQKESKGRDWGLNVPKHSVF